MYTCKEISSHVYFYICAKIKFENLPKRLTDINLYFQIFVLNLVESFKFLNAEVHVNKNVKSVNLYYVFCLFTWVDVILPIVTMAIAMVRVFIPRRVSKNIYFWFSLSVFFFLPGDLYTE